MLQEDHLPYFVIHNVILPKTSREDALIEERTENNEAQGIDSQTKSFMSTNLPLFVDA